MKVTALIDDELIEKVKKISGGKNITESITIALKYYLQHKNLDELMDNVEKEPLQFREDFTAYGIRKINRDL
ncbi:MAG: type II toxin-antitoxin system VapB family antitoxin [Cyclobacteriaceae bacterium]